MPRPLLVLPFFVVAACGATHNDRAESAAHSVTVGHTGCSTYQLVTFDFEEGQQGSRWKALCRGTYYQCHGAGGSTDCEVIPEESVTDEMRTDAESARAARTFD